MTSEQRKEAEERERWAKAEERAKGGKVADQEGTLKRAVKRLEKKKSKSGKEWCVLRFSLFCSHSHPVVSPGFPPSSCLTLNLSSLAGNAHFGRCQAVSCGGQ